MPHVLKSLVVSIFLLLPIVAGQACGPMQSFSGYVFLNPSLIGFQKDKYPLVTTFAEFARYYQREDTLKQDANVLEWRSRVCQQAEYTDVWYFIYKSQVADLKELLTSMQAKNLPNPALLDGNTFAEYLHDNGCPETVLYLLYAKNCEVYVEKPDPWSKMKRDKKEMRTLFIQGKRQFFKTKSNFIKHRYAFQLIRLAHYGGWYEEGIALFSELQKGMLEDNTLVDTWTLGHRAGCLNQLGRKAEAAYDYLRIFMTDPYQRAMAMRSLPIKTDAVFAETLELCSSEKEKAALYAMRSSGFENKSLNDMRIMYDYDPQSPYLNQLLVKEVKRLERDLLGLTFNYEAARNKALYKIPSPESAQYAVQFLKFVIEVRGEGKITQPSLWQLSEGYLELITGDYYAAQQTFDLAKAVIKDKDLLKQLEVFQLALEISKLESINAEVEQKALNWRRSNATYKTAKDFPDFLRDKLTSLYKKAGQEGLAFRLQHDIRDLKLNPNPDLVEDLILLCRKENKNDLELKLSTNESGQSLLYDLIDLKASQLLSDGFVEAALKVFEEIPIDQWNRYGRFAPFVERVRDCVHCGLKAADADFYNKGQLMAKLIDLEYKSKSDLNNSAKYYYELGLAYYNITYFGSSWQVLDAFRSGTSWSKLHTQQPIVSYEAPLGNKEQTNLTKALNCFENARVLTKNKDLSAKAAFMSAKCQLNQYVTSKNYKAPSSPNQMPNLPSEYRNYHKLLKQFYADSEVYKQISQRCKYLEHYAR